MEKKPIKKKCWCGNAFGQCHQPIEEKWNWQEEFDEMMKTPECLEEFKGQACNLCGQPWDKSEQVKKLKSFIENLLEQERKRTMDGLESVYKQARWSEEGYDALDEVKKAIAEEVEKLKIGDCSCKSAKDSCQICGGVYCKIFKNETIENVLSLLKH